MKAKILSILLLAAAVSATTAFASGTSDEAQPAPGPWARGWAGPEGSDQTVTLTGAVSLKDAWHPILKTGAEDYYLMVPRPYLYQVKVSEGDSVKVEGYVFERAPWQSSDDKTKSVVVTRATINGKDYDVPRGPTAMGRGGRGPGMRGGRGYGPGMMGGDWGPRGSWR